MRYFYQGLIIACIGGLLLAKSAWAENIRAGAHADFSRLVLETLGTGGYALSQDGQTISLKLDKPMSTALPDTLPRALAGYVTAWQQVDTSTLQFTVVAGVQARAFVNEGNLVIDFRQASDTKPVEPAKAIAAPVSVPTGKAVRVRVGEHADFTRLVFDWPESVDYSVKQSRGQVALTFTKVPSFDSASVQKRLPAGLTIKLDGATVTVSGAFTSAKTMRSGNSIVLDLSGKPLPAKPAPTIAPTSLQKVDSAPLVLPESLTLTPSAALGTNSLNLRFPWTDARAAAVFQRGGWLWIVFDQSAAVDLATVQRDAGNTLFSIEQVPHDSATILRAKLSKPLAPSLWQEDTIWHVNLRPQKWQVDSVAALVPLPNAKPPQLEVRLDGLSAPVDVTDPLIGDSIIIVPTRAAGHGMEATRRFPEFSLLQTAQGIVVEPYSDDILVDSLPAGIRIRSASGLAISDAPPSRPTEIPATIAPTDWLYDFSEWALVPSSEFFARRGQLQNDITSATRQQKNVRRLEYAQFLFAHGYWQEADSVLRAIVDADGTLARTIPVAALRGAIQFLTNRPQEAVTLFTSLPSFEAYPERNLWLAASYGALRQWDEGMAAFNKAGSLPQAYPAMVAVPIAVALSELLIARQEWGQLTKLQDSLAILDVTPAQRQRLDFIKAQELLRTDKNTEARALLTTLSASTDQWVRTRASFTLLNDDLERGRLTDEEAIPLLERLRFAWRGDHFELAVMERLAELYLKTKQYRDALRLLEQIALRFPAEAERQKIADQKQQIFVDLYLNGQADSLPPLTALALYDEFRLLTPNDQRGDEMIRKLADRLVAVDLLDRAATLLEHQVRKRLTGEERARVGARLALIQLLDRKAGNAVQALDFSDYSGISDRLRDERKYLRARALMMNNKPEEALALLDLDESATARLLRLEIFWDMQNYRQLAVTARQLVTAPPFSKTVDEKQAQYILNLALALSLDGQYDALNTVKEHYTEAMQATPLAEAFKLISHTPADSSLNDLTRLSSQFADIQAFENFLEDYRDRLRQAPLSDIN